MTYIVIFETSDPAVDDNVSRAVKAFGDWAELTSQSYLLDTTHEVRTLMETLQLGATDSLWVFSPKSPWSSHGEAIAEDHAEGYLGKAEDYVPKDWDEAIGSRC